VFPASSSFLQTKKKGGRGKKTKKKKKGPDLLEIVKCNILAMIIFFIHRGIFPFLMKNNILKNLDLRPISNPNSTGNVISVPLMNNNKISFNESVSIDNKKKIATKLIINFFSPLRALCSKPVYSTNIESNSNNISNLNKDNNVNSNLSFNNLDRQEKLVINLFYYITDKNQVLSNTAVNKLGNALAKLLEEPVELRLVRLHYPYLNSYILAQYVAINSKKYNFTRIQRAVFASLLLPRPKSIATEFISKLNENNSTTTIVLDKLLPSHITGVMIRISGRLKTQRSIPRQTVQTAQIGTFSPSKGIKNVIEFASLTDKNKKGAFTVKVWISQLPSLSNK
jgi:hypothetical protein